jgi:hypothetical protein
MRRFMLCNSSPGVIKMIKASKMTREEQVERRGGENNIKMDLM